MNDKKTDIKAEFKAIKPNRQGVEARSAAVALIGCGPGDPELLTLKALKWIEAADVLVIDRLVNDAVLEHARDGAAHIFVGKTPGIPSTSQEEINAILVREAKAGRKVARLKGGDPFVFGRAVEEMRALQAAGVAYEIVPGITAAHACAASIQLPITARSLHRKFSLLTGATADGILAHDWTSLAHAGEAFAVYMGVRSASAIRDKLLSAGISAAAPVVIVENGTLADERAFATTVRDLVVCMHEQAVQGPAVLFFGLDWAELGLETPASVQRFEVGNVVPFAGPAAAPKRTPRRKIGG